MKQLFGLLTAFLGVLGLLVVSTSSAAAGDDHRNKPTIVLVHGAFADSSSWNGVVERLQRKGYPVIAAANPLRGLESDAAYVASVVKDVTGLVILVGHSYGGAVISAAARANPQVKGLVYIAAFLPDTGESPLALSGKFPGGKLGPDTIKAVPYPGGTDIYIKQAAFRDVFAADVPAREAAAMAATQRPVENNSLGGVFVGTPAWRTIPSWALVASQDNAIPPAAERFMAERANAHIVEVKASHAVSVSHPDAVTNLITAAANAS
jgi:pimeloyl-ACP methyl ester carboxylesterase